MRCIAISRWGEPLEEIDRQTPIADAASAVVRITACGLCHSDLHIHDGYFDMGGGQKLELPDQMLPLVLGHEPEGVVEALGPEASARNPTVKVGDRVAVYPWLGCGACAACARGEQEICVGENRALGTRWPGGFASHLYVPDSAALIPVGDLPPGAGGVAMCSGLTGYAAVEKIAGGGQDELVVLIGMGGVGLMALEAAKALHKGPLIAIDLDPNKRAAAIDRGAASAIDPTDAASIAAFMADTGGAYAAIDLVGSEATFNLATQVVRRGGKAVIVGLYGGAATLPVPSLPFRALTIMGSYVGSLDQARRLIALMRQGKIAAPPMQTRPLFAGANAAVAALRRGEVVGRLVLTP